MEGPTDEASIPTGTERMSCTLKRKVGKKTCVTMLTAVNILLSPKDTDIPARKKPRVQASLPAIVAEADSLNALPDASVAVASANVGTVPVAANPMKPNAGAARAPRRGWTSEEDTKLTTAVKTTCKKKYGANFKTDWDAIAALVPGRTKLQCWNRWHNVLDSKSDETTTRKSQQWTKQENSTLTDAVKKHNGDWAAISELVPGRTKQQCLTRWHYALPSNSDDTIARVGKWTKNEDSRLTDAVEKHNGKDWVAISSLVPGRTKHQCYRRWHGILDSKSDETTARKGQWTKDEDGKLTDAVEKYNGKNWAAISELVQGRTEKQCNDRWVKSLAPSRITSTEEEHGTAIEASALG
jgi:hypothetical protein